MRRSNQPHVGTPTRTTRRYRNQHVVYAPFGAGGQCAKTHRECETEGGNSQNLSCLRAVAVPNKQSHAHNRNDAARTTQSQSHTEREPLSQSHRQAEAEPHSRRTRSPTPHNQNDTTRATQPVEPLRSQSHMTQSEAEPHSQSQTSTLEPDNQSQAR